MPEVASSLAEAVDVMQRWEERRTAVLERSSFFSLEEWCKTKFGKKPRQLGTAKIPVFGFQRISQGKTYF